MARSQLSQHAQLPFARHDRGCGPHGSEVATSVRPGGCGDSASHEATTSAKARSSRSGSASTRARNSSLTATSALRVTMTDHTETGWRSFAVAEITWESPAETRRYVMLVRSDPFRQFDRLAEQVFGTVARPAAMPMDCLLYTSPSPRD